MDLTKTIAEAVETVERWCKNKGIKIEVKLNEKISKIYADRDRISQVFINLLTNSIKYTPPKGKIEIISGMAKERDFSDNGKKDKWIAVTVRDNGIGIPEQDLEKIFERFYKSDTPQRLSSLYSSGLGLSIVKEIVELHGGKITVESKVNQGSSFTVFLPFKTQP